MVNPLLLAGPLLGCALAAADDSMTSGRPPTVAQTCYDVTHYDLRLRVDPEEESLAGTLRMEAVLLQAAPRFELDLHRRLTVEAVTVEGQPAEFEHEQGVLSITPVKPLDDLDTEFEVEVRYGGKPREAPRPPWDGGLTWTETRGGDPWVATSCQGEGADLWWPCKDQPGDEPEDMAITVTVPAPLVCASNGRLLGVDEEEDGWLTYRWYVSMPISTYSVALNIAPYETIEREYTSVAGDTFPVIYWVLPENREEGEALMEDVLRQMAFMERTFGPYPFRADKYGIAETPHLGMEHQSIIAYGNRYRGNPWGTQHGFDNLHLHEFAHEWWANLVTARNWKDFWIHESFGTYCEALYTEEVSGFEGYKLQMEEKRDGVLNQGAIAPREPRSTNEMYFSAGNPDAPGLDIYNKGSWVLHTLRWLMGDEKFFEFLRRMAYPTPELEAVTDGGQCRFSDTEEVVAIAERVAGRELGWFFEVYLRQPALPVLHSEVEDGRLVLRWDVPDDRPFPMPVQVRVGEELVRVELPEGEATVEIPAGGTVEVDPHAWLLKAREER